MITKTVSPRRPPARATRHRRRPSPTRRRDTMPATVEAMTSVGRSNRATIARPGDVSAYSVMVVLAPGPLDGVCSADAFDLIVIDSPTEVGQVGGGRIILASEVPGAGMRDPPGHSFQRRAESGAHQHPVMPRVALPQLWSYASTSS